MSLNEANCSSQWSREQDKAFENALAIYPEDISDRWEKIAADVEGKTVKEIEHHYELLLNDINQIESGFVPLPIYNSSSEGLESHDGGEEGSGKKGGHFGNLNRESSSHGGKASRSDQERRKGIAWTEEEHRLFLLGLDKYGKGDWRSISRNFVVTRTPTQVASHAQKYFVRLNSMNKERRRSSIHDITSVGNADILPAPGPITGQSNGTAVGGGGSCSGSKPTKVGVGVGSPGMGMYGGTPAIGQPIGIGGPMGSAIGTPVNLTTPAHMAYGVRASIPGAMVTGAPMNMGPTYPMMPHTSAPR